MQNQDYTELTPNQVVAFNLAKAREIRGLSQTEAGAALEQFLGTKWSKATFSAAERSIDGKRIKTFSADEIVAFARCFGLSVCSFFEPPDRHVRGRLVRVKCSAIDGETTDPEDFKHIVRGDLRDKDDVQGLLAAIALNLSFKARYPEWDFRNVEPPISEEVERLLSAIKEFGLEVVLRQDAGPLGFALKQQSQPNKAGKKTNERRRKRKR